MLKNIFKSIKSIIDFGKPKPDDSNKSLYSDYKKIIEEINSFNFSDFSESELSSRITEFKTRFGLWIKDSRNKFTGGGAGTGQDFCIYINVLMQKDSFVSEFLTECYAITKDICRRVLKVNPYNSQLLTGVALHFGNVAELPTGEGKTMAAVFAAVMNALTGLGVHVFTFNSYLAKRDALWMKDIYEYWGLSVGYIQEGMDSIHKRASYESDITYMTPKEAGFDYLRDTLVYHRDELVHRPFNFVIVDEADSILIDEARVPLVIAGNTDSDFGTMDKALVHVAKKLKEGRDYRTDENKRNVYLTDTGISEVEKALDCENLYDNNVTVLTFINNLIHAKTLLKKDIDYIVRNGKIEIVDEFTGRVAEKRKWHDGLQMAVEALEGVSNTQNSRILGKLTLQNFISLYPKVCGMTATGQSSKDELMDTYKLPVYVVEPHKKCIRTDYADRIFTHEEAKFEAIVSDIAKVHESERPILIGTSSIEESQRLAGSLEKRGISCVVLNAKNDFEEAKIIAQAGRPGKVTVSTNMAGRGVDIKLGAGGEPEEVQKVIELGGLYVIGTGKNECVRIDNQLRGRAGRQGDPGASRFYVSLLDDIMVKFQLQDELPEKYLGLKQTESINDNKLNKLIDHIQRVIDGQNFEIRKTLGKYAYILEYQRRILFGKRTEILMENTVPVLEQYNPKKYHQLCEKFGAEKVKEIIRRISLHFIDETWYDFLEFCESTKEGIELASANRKNPLDEYHKLTIEEFDKLYRQLDMEILKELDRADFAMDMDSLIREGLNTPASTWTYIINDNIRLKRFSIF